MDPIELDLSRSLEDYLETIYDLVRTNKVARVKEIAKIRNVKPGSVSPAMKRLSELGLIKYEQREFIDLTPTGEVEARKIHARHDLLTRFFSEILGMGSQAAEADACSMEHSLSNEGMDRLTRFFEFLKMCPDQEAVIDRFHDCTRVNPDRTCKKNCPIEGVNNKKRHKSNTITVADMTTGQTASVRQVDAQGEIRTKLLDMGILPDVKITLESISPSDELNVKVAGYTITLSRDDAGCIVVSEN